jgi:hypothetical protein
VEKLSSATSWLSWDFESVLVRQPPGSKTKVNDLETLGIGDKTVTKEWEGCQEKILKAKLLFQHVNSCLPDEGLFSRSVKRIRVPVVAVLNAGRFLRSFFKRGIRHAAQILSS